jgi:FAD/FMN-containing dehydrogenase
MALRTDVLKRAKERRVADWPPEGDPVYAQVKPTKKELEAFAKQLVGLAVFPWSPGYNTDRQGNPRYPAFPQIIVYCAVPADVALSLAFAQKWDYWVTCRSGGHSTAGYSLNDGMVIDVSRIGYVSVDPIAKLARVGAGATFEVVNSVLDSFQLHVPGGGCPTVGVGGYVQGGGYGFTSREFGMSSDNVVEVTVMLASGAILVADRKQNPKLFWAVRGGTGDNFGVLLEVVYQLHDLYQVWGFALEWSATDAPQALATLQSSFMRGGASPKLGYQVALATIDGQPKLAMLGMYHGTRAQGIAALGPLVASGTLVTDEMGTYQELNEGLLNILTPPSDWMLELKRSGYIATPLGVQGWTKVVQYFATTPNPVNIAIIEPYGGAIAKVPVEDSAFIHRDVDMDFFVDSFYAPDHDFTTEPQAKAWLDGFMKVVQPFMNGQVYQNYPERGLANYKQAYWGGAVAGLEDLKKKLDPTGFFRFEQSV